MQSYQLFINDTNPGIRIQIAKTFSDRFLGLMGKKDIPRYGLLINKCRGIHTFFMHFNIDVIFLNSENKVIKIIRNLPPWKMTMPVLSAKSVLEIPAKLIGVPVLKLNDIATFK